MDTYFAPAQRTERRKFTNQVETISRNPIMDALLKVAEGILVVLNEDRQIVALNHAFLKGIGVKDAEKVLGLRLGETLHCVHAFEKPNGCGTTEYCLSCGAAVAMMAAIAEDKTQEQICALLSDKNGDITNTCLLIKAQPIRLEDTRWILIYARDITRQQFWINLERIFFHDINNVLTSIYGNVQLLEMKLSENGEVGSLKTGIERIIREVEMQKSFSLHKQEGINILCKTVSLGEILQEVRLIFTGHRSSLGKHVQEEWPQQEIVLYTDPILVSRILGNMIINAFESSGQNEIIHLKALITENQICFEVRNAGYIPSKIQKRIFQRHFSTKPGEGRGMGTYSMKLLGEKYLQGKVSFISSKEGGTVFTFCLPR
jgi:signal transduction histidine kinase